MKNSTLLGIGIGGTVLAALCCFTPILLILLGVVGWGALTGYLDFVLLPTLLVFIGITVYALKKRGQTGTAMDRSVPDAGPKP
ncbi:MAG: mercury resistance system transport protein MerF [Burkholderiales bacterium]|nr:mercury resistance system transport protein MerF [Burkholderiales bacterium]